MKALLDACVLFPQYLRDTLLLCAEARLFDPLWSGEILDELRRNLINDLGLSVGRVDRLLAQMESSFPQARVAGHELFIPQMTNHPKDRHVLAAALVRQADVLVTFNLRDFPAGSLPNERIAVVSPDAFLTAMFFESPGSVEDVLTGQAAKYDHPAMSLGELFDRLDAGVPVWSCVTCSSSACSTAEQELQWRVSERGPVDWLLLYNAFSSPAGFPAPPGSPCAVSPARPARSRRLNLADPAPRSRPPAPACTSFRSHTAC